MKKWIITIFFTLYKNSDGTTYYKNSRETILNRAKECCKNNQERIREQEGKERIWKKQI